MTHVPSPEITLTLRQLREIALPGCDRLQVLIANLGPDWSEDQPITFEQGIQSNGLDDALFALRAVPEHSALWRHFAVDCAERVRHLMTDPRSVNTLRVARQYAMGMVSDEELAAARDDAYAAWASASAWASANATCSACYAAGADERQWQAQRLIHLTQTGVWTAP